MSQVRKGSRRLREMRVEDAGPPPTQEPLQAVGGRPARGPGAPRQFRALKGVRAAQVRAGAQVRRTVDAEESGSRGGRLPRSLRALAPAESGTSLRCAGASCKGTPEP